MKKGIFSLLLLLIPLGELNGGDIYYYVDKEGVFHFSNVPSEVSYRPYLRRGPLFRYKRDSNLYDHIIRRACQRYGVDFALVKAIIRAESAFDPYAISRKGAEGLMQIMPQTSRWLNLSNPFDPWENIEAGVRYLKYLLIKFNYNLPLVLAAYNAGENLVEERGSVPNYPETKNYITEVMRYYREYKRRYGKKPRS